jgi:hypothetical protein
MVRGLDKFISHFKGMEENYVLIGGSACDVWLTSQGLPFRLTKDLDMVIIVEALEPKFVKAFWNFIRQGDYQSLNQSSGNPKFYRFENPKDKLFPYMVELLSRNHLDLPKGIHLTPIPVDADISSLSAILLNDDYYKFVRKEKILLDGAPIVPPQCLIPLKARAHLDLKKRKVDGDTSVRDKDIKKHRNDVFRLSLSIAPADHYDLQDSIASDVKDFLETLPTDSDDWDAIKKALKASRLDLPAPEESIRRIKDIFNLK